MAENNENYNGLINKLALISDAAEDVFKKGRIAVVFELDKETILNAKKELLIPNEENKEFKIDMGSTEFIFLPNELLNDETNNS